TNFKLSKEGGYLGLFGPDAIPVSEFRPAYPAQQSNISYGRDVIDPALMGYFSTPTPRARNSSSGPGIAIEPSFSQDGGVFTNTSISVVLSAPAGEIRYTINGTPPSSTSPLYTGPLTVTTSTTVKARVYQAGRLPSPIAARNYMLVDSSVAGFTSNLPLMIFSTSGRSISNHVPAGQLRTFASVAAIDTFRGRSSTLGTPDYFGQCEMGVRGQTSASFPKKPYRVELQDPYRTDLNASFFGLPAGADWILNNPYSDKPFIQNFLAQELFEKMGHYAVRRRFVEVFINTMGGRINYPRDYAGIYILLEKIKVDNNRVEIPKLTPYDTTEPDISGGYMFKKDKDSAGDLNFSTVGGNGFSPQALKIHEPTPATITTAQRVWIRNYLIQFEKALYATNWLSAKGTNHYSNFIDADSFIDYQWIVEFSKQIDGYRLSNYFSKDRNGKVKMEPIWDWNLSFGNADYADGFNTTGWYYSTLDENSHIWLHRLMFGTPSTFGTTGDPDFNQKITDRWSVLRTNVFAPSNVLARVDELAGILNEAAARDFKKWPRLGTYIWPNPGFYATPTTYAGIISAMKTWISGRYKWIDSQFPRSPLLGLNSGRVAPGSLLSITNTGPLYYTLDGSDPRLPGGSISTNAFLYGGPITLRSNTHLTARGKSGAKWSGPVSASYIITTPPLIITELMYHPPPPPPGSLYTEDDFEFFEFNNSGDNAIELTGYHFTRGIEFTFPLYTVGSHQRFLLVKNRAAFESRYGYGLPVTGEYIGNLDNHGERLTLVSRFGDIVLDFTYQDTFLPITDGAGFSLVLVDENVSAQLSTDSLEWHASSSFGGTPGVAEKATPAFPTVVVNELLSHAPPGSPDVVELQNLSPTAASVGGWFLTDDFNHPKKYRIREGTVIGPGGFFTLDSSDFTTNNTTSFGFSSLGESIYLFSGDAGTNLSGYVHGYSFGPQNEGVSFGRFVDSIGSEHFVAQSVTTFAATNARPLVPPVILSEIMYHPADLSLNGALWNDTEDEYIELWNRTDQSVPLFNPNVPTNSWKITGGVEFTFPTNTPLAGKSYLIVVGFDPATNLVKASAFRNKYGLSTDVPLTGPFSGHLGNAKETISLLVP
ncbi:MAG: CotH protein, partial [Verrucomicrobiales bacterium]|nr:CotH protein [Verrucomicrobiales bacterium]